MKAKQRFSLSNGIAAGWFGMLLLCSIAIPQCGPIYGDDAPGDDGGLGCYQGPPSDPCPPGECYFGGVCTLQFPSP